MRLTETKTMQHIRIVDTGIKCDLCGEVTDPNGWEENCKGYSCHINAEVHDNYPEGERRGVKAEFCPKCTAMVVAALIKLGVNFEEYSSYD